MRVIYEDSRHILEMQEDSEKEEPRTYDGVFCFWAHHINKWYKEEYSRIYIEIDAMKKELIEAKEVIWSDLVVVSKEFNLLDSEHKTPELIKMIKGIKEWIKDKSELLDLMVLEEKEKYPIKKGLRINKDLKFYASESLRSYEKLVQEYQKMIQSLKEVLAFPDFEGDE